MDQRWRVSGVSQHRRIAVLAVVFLLLFHQNLSPCWSLNIEGLALLRFRDRVVTDPFGALSNWNNNGGEDDHCSWFGVECSDGKVVILNLRDLCLGGTLAPDLGKLAYIKSIILRNNSFTGNIPKEIAELMELEVLDLGYNNFTGPFPSDFSNNPSLTTLLLDNNRFLGSISSELHQLKMLLECRVDQDQLTDAAFCISRSISWSTAKPEDAAHRRLQQVADDKAPSRFRRAKENERGSLPTSASSSSSPPLHQPSLPPSQPFSVSLPPSTFSSSLSLDSPLPSPSSSPSASPSSSFPAPSPSPLVAPTPASPVPRNPPTTIFPPPESSPEPIHSPSLSPSQVAQSNSNSRHRVVIICAGVVGGCLLIFLAVVGIIVARSSKVVTVKPWATGLSGQLQKAFVTGVPKLNRSELEAACEDFSNVIGSLSDGNVYKGTLSSGVEIAVTSITMESAANWTKSLEAQFRKKIETLSKVNHKNFVNLIGFCEEDKPFTRIMVFEYAPNGTLFEHLHIKEAEHLDWGMRLRIAMGMAYCLEYMHQLKPPIVQKNLQSSSVYLTEDYAAKISDFTFLNEVTTAKMGSVDKKLCDSMSTDPESNVYSFGVILFEMITGRIPYSVENGSLEDWASHYLKGDKSLREIVDPSLNSFQEEELSELFRVIKDCVHPDPKQRPTMTEITGRLKVITAMGPDGATPKLSPLWWAELEIMSTEGN
ncbi:probable inactive receptor-like protein kinase At3g56050 [Malus sylvestris]|uniref:probable inactive receptor-like protein kinase At3g56050 n=1 Tax=Malus sylvestris TaxID=3752 RepID=UPI0021AC0A12|nr:probable inactive receptor-like protein kinase At3g56050 [Malus sylvestris]XP_050139301.1 probable inactive receptor-like protein kinase At3g56050 [Malus sylvestris]